MLVQSPHSKAPPVPGHNLSSGQLTDPRREREGTNMTYTASTADIPQNSTLRLSTRLGADEARTAFNEDQVRLRSKSSKYHIIYSVLQITIY